MGLDRPPIKKNVLGLSQTRDKQDGVCKLGITESAIERSTLDYLCVAASAPVYFCLPCVSSRKLYCRGTFVASFFCFLCPRVFGRVQSRFDLLRCLGIWGRYPPMDHHSLKHVKM